MAKAKSLAQVNRAIHKEFPHVNLFRGEGYFFIYSDNEKWADAIATLPSSSIYTYRLNQQSVEQWVSDVRRLVAQIDWEDAQALPDFNICITMLNKNG